MPRTREALALTERFHSRVDALAIRAGHLAASFVGGVDRADMQQGLEALVAQSAVVIEVAQANAASLAGGYVRALGRAEIDEPIEVDPAEDNEGLTADGRPVASALAATPAKVFLALKKGRTPDEALEFARFSVARLAQTEVMDAARIELAHAIKEAEPIIGWRWRSRGTCPACMAMDDGVVRTPGRSLNAHPYCQCIQEPVLDVEEQFTAETAKERFLKLSPEEQERLVGEKYAKILRDERVNWNTVVTEKTSEQWRAMLTRKTVAEVEDVALSNDQVLAQAINKARTGDQFSAEIWLDRFAAEHTTAQAKSLVKGMKKWTNGRYQNIRREIREIVEGTGPGSDEARAILQTLKGTSADSPVLYRGMNLSQTPETIIKQYVQGDTLDLPIVSFTKELKQATRFAQQGGLGGGRTGKGATQLVIRVEKGSRSLKAEGFAGRLHREREWISGGRFRVKRVTRSGSQVNVTLEQIGTFGGA